MILIHTYDFEGVLNLQESVNGIFDFETVFLGNAFYPEKSFRSWYTNKYDLISWAVFFVIRTEGVESYFRFIDPETKELVKYREQSLSISFFQVKKPLPRFFIMYYAKRDCDGALDSAFLIIVVPKWYFHIRENLA